MLPNPTSQVLVTIYFYKKKKKLAIDILSFLLQKSLKKMTVITCTN